MDDYKLPPEQVVALTETTPLPRMEDDETAIPEGSEEGGETSNEAPTAETPENGQEGPFPAGSDGPTPEGSGEQDPTVDPDPSAGANEPFLAGTWKGHKRYQCPECSYAVVRADGPVIIYQHLGQVHHIVEISKVLAPDGRPIAKVSRK